MACQIKVSVKVVKRRVDIVQVHGSDPALCSCSSWPEKLSIRHECQAGTQAALPLLFWRDEKCATLSCDLLSSRSWPDGAGRKKKNLHRKSVFANALQSIVSDLRSKVKAFFPIPLLFLISFYSRTGAVTASPARFTTNILNQMGCHVEGKTPQAVSQGRDYTLAAEDHTCILTRTSGTVWGRLPCQ